jgi:flagellar biosynthesis protein FlhG
VPDDHHVSRAVKRKTPLLHAFPHCPAARSIDRIAATFLMERKQTAPSGIRGFLQRMKRLWG